MSKDYNPSFPQSRFPSIPVTIAVEYKDPAMHRNSSLPSKIILDFGYLGLSRPSPADIYDSIGDWVEVHLACVPFELKRLRLYEISQDRAITGLKDHCGIKRIWRLARHPRKPVCPSLKRPIANNDSDTDIVEKRKKTDSDLPLSITSSSETDSTPSPSVTSFQDMPVAFIRLQERLSTTGNGMHVGPLEQPQSHVQVKGTSREQDTPSDTVMLRMLPLDQSELPQSADIGDYLPEDPLTQTRDPRRSGLNRSTSPGESTGSQEQNGYPKGTRLLLVDTYERHPRGWETNLRRLFQHGKRRQAELETSINKQEREEARSRIESLENELQEMRRLVREIRTESEMRKVKNIDLEAKIEDIRRECEHPFIVPSLIDAFLRMGDLRNAVIQD